MQLNANRAANHREPTDFTSFCFSLLSSQARLGTTPTARLPATSTEVFSDQGRHAFFWQDWLYADPWRCAALSYKLHFHLLLTKKTKHRDADAVLQGQHELQRYKTRNELHRGVQTHVNQPSKSASCETSKQTHAQPLLPYITEATEAPFFFSESGKTLGHTQFHCADAFHLTLRVEGLDAVKHHARRTFHGQVVRTCPDEYQVDASACCIHDELSIFVSGVCTAVSASKPTLTCPCSWLPA